MRTLWSLPLFSSAVSLPTELEEPVCAPVKVTMAMITKKSSIGAILYGNVIYTIGSMLVAAATTVRNYRFMIFGRVVLAFGDIATHIAQYKIFSSWFPTSNGFASTLGLELAIGKVGSPSFGSARRGLMSVTDRWFRWEVNLQHHCQEDR